MAHSVWRPCITPGSPRILSTSKGFHRKRPATGSNSANAITVLSPAAMSGQDQWAGMTRRPVGVELYLRGRCQVCIINDGTARVTYCFAKGLILTACGLRPLAFGIAIMQRSVQSAAGCITVSIGGSPRTIGAEWSLVRDPSAARALGAPAAYAASWSSL